MGSWRRNTNCRNLSFKKKNKDVNFSMTDAEKIVWIANNEAVALDDMRFEVRRTR